VGSVVIALALDIFLVPNKIAAGGVSGLATIFFHLFRLPVGWVLLALNIPLFLLSFRELGGACFHPQCLWCTGYLCVCGIIGEPCTGDDA
jgi:uncharacterized membrane-anchored protein YitT (DUF2179 family)